VEERLGCAVVKRVAEQQDTRMMVAQNDKARALCPKAIGVKTRQCRTKWAHLMAMMPM
jgi:hypothetical protein